MGAINSCNRFEFTNESALFPLKLMRSGSKQITIKLFVDEMFNICIDMYSPRAGTDCITPQIMRVFVEEKSFLPHLRIS